MTGDESTAEFSPEKRELLKLLLENDQLQTPSLTRTSNRTGFPLSFVQERMWISEKFAPAGAHSTCIDAKGALDVGVLQKAFQEIVRRHEVLRSTFDADEPVQIVHEHMDAKVTQLDLRTYTESAREAEIRRLVEEESQRPFDLILGPLWRFSVLRLEDDRHLMFVSFHHLVFDGWSTSVLSEELGALYDAFLRGQPSPLLELPVQYGDFALWQRKWAKSETVRQQVSYWARQLGGDLPALKLPRDRRMPEIRTFESASVDFQLPGTLYRKVDRMSREEGVTPFMTMLAAFKTLMYLATGQVDIVVGSPVANRSRLETEKLIGCFMHPLVLRTILSGDPSFRELLARVRRVCLDAFARQDVPFELVVRELRPKWDGRHMPLFQILFNVQRAEVTPVRMTGLILTPNVITPSSALDMTVHLWTGGETVQGIWEYSTELFDRTTVEWLLKGYEWVLERVVEDAGRKLSSFAGWGQREKDALPALSQERRELLDLLLAEEGRAPVAEEVQERDAIPRLERTGEPLEASFGQDRLWFFEQLEPGNALFNESAALRLEGPLDVDVFERAWRELARRQESLRTSLVYDSGSLKQVIVSHVELPIVHIDLTSLSRDEQQQRVQRLISQEAEQVFKLSRAPLWRLVLARLSPQEHVLLVTIHHLIWDGWSAEVCQGELAALYDAYLHGRPSPLPELMIQYADYAAWQRQRLRGPWLHEELGYWKRQLGGELPLLVLPADRMRKASGNRRRGAVEAFEIPERVHQELRKLGQREGTTLYMTMLAVFQTLLYRYTGEKDILIDTGVAGRNRTELTKLLGFFMNSVILRTDLSGHPTFRELLGRARRVCLGALEHQEVPLDRVVSEIGGDRRGMGGALTPVSFTLREAVAKRQELGGGVRLVEIKNQVSDEFDLTMFLWQEPEGLQGQLKYDPDLFERETIQRMIGHFMRLLEAVVVNPEAKLDEIVILTEDERQELVQDWNETGEQVGDRQCIHERFEAKAKERPEAIAVRLSRGMRENGKEYELSYGELDRRANQLARYLRKREVKAETRVGLCVGRSLELATAVLGILKSGGAYVPLDLGQPRERLQKVIEGSGVSVVVTREAERQKLGDLADGMVVVEVEEAKGESAERLESGVVGGNAAYVIYTSGSTGEPKGVVVSHASVVNHNVAVTKRFGLEETDRVLQFHTISFDAAVEELFPTWGAGATVVMRSEELVSPGEELEKLIGQEQMTVVNLPTAYWHEWVVDGKRRQGITADGLRLVIVGGDKVSAERYEQWQELTGGRVRWVNTYGPTETTVISSLYEPETGAGGREARARQGEASGREARARQGEASGREARARQGEASGREARARQGGASGREARARQGEARARQGEASGREARARQGEASGEVSGGMSIGRPIGNTRMYVLDERLEPVPIGVGGELWIGGEGLARGYMGRTDLTAERFTPDPFVEKGGARMYRTGDRVRYRRGGKLEFLGRVDEQVKIRGFRVEPAEVESALRKHPRVNEAVVTGWRCSETETRLVAYVVPVTSVSPDTDERLTSIGESSLVVEIRQYLADILPEYMVPSAFIELAALPLNPNGKLDRRALPAPESKNPQEAQPIHLLPQTELERTIATIWQEVLDLPQVGLYDNFFDLGGHSLLLTRVHFKLVAALQREIPMVEMFRYPTIQSLARFLGQEGATPVALESNVARVQKQRAVWRGTETAADAIAIVGMSGRFPGARDIDGFWQILRNGVEAITFFTDEELVAVGVDPALLAHPDYVRAAAVLDDVESFDASFFGYNPREAEIMDPQRRFFLECASEALEDAGYDPARYPGLIGVYAGQSMSQYAIRNIMGRPEVLGMVGGYQTGISNDKDFLATTVSYKLGLRGPSVSVQTACSTSLVAVIFACQNLLNHDCDMALAGGVTIALPNREGYLYHEGHIASPDGHCRAFDARAKGIVGSSGSATVVLKRLSDALADGDTIHAVIRGFALNNDGSLKVGFTAPSVEGQAEVIARAQAMAGIDPETITYVEAHGTGTTLGDPIEIAALTKAFRLGTSKKQFCAIGSLKTNMGHMDTAAGVAGLIKTVLALRHGQIPPSLNFETPNPHIDFASSPFYVNTKLQEWPANGTLRRAGVSAFGIGGTNAHVVVEEAPAPDPSGASRPWQLVLLSAKTASARDRMAANLAAHLQNNLDKPLADVAYTLHVGRRVFNHRLMLVCRDAGEAANALQSIDGVDKNNRRVVTAAGETRERPVVFMLPGQGAQYVNMGKGLYESESTFREAIDRCCELLRDELGCDLREVLYPMAGNESTATEALQKTAITQPALFVVEYALSQLWQEWGVRPAAMIGHSLGEYVAACLAGVFTLEDALRLVAARGRLMQQLPGGAMLAVPLPEAELQLLLNGALGSKLSLAAVNGPSMCVVSGSKDAVEALEAELTRRGLEWQRLHTSHAFHSSMMEPILDIFTERLNRMTLRAPAIPFLSNLTGTWITVEEATSPQYWVQHLRRTVRFAEGAQELLKDADRILLEVGPGRTLSTLVKQHREARDGRVILCSLRSPNEAQPDMAFLLNSVGHVWLAGATIDWNGFYAHEKRQRVEVPTYPFERQRYWIDAGAAVSAPSPRADLSGKKPDLADWFYAPVWQESPVPAADRAHDLASKSWVVLADTVGLGTQLAAKLEALGHRVVTVTPGPGFVSLGGNAYVIRRTRQDDYVRLLRELKTRDTQPWGIIHLWNITAPAEQPGTADTVDAALDNSFYSLLALAQGLWDAGLTEPVHLATISNGLCEVTGEETVRPEKAALLGPMRVIPQEYPNLICRSIDVSLPGRMTRSEQRMMERLVEQLVSELCGQPSSDLVAFRGNRRWERTFKALRLEGKEEASDSGRMRLREEGVYLVTGGTGGLGLVLAEFLAERVRAKLVLTARGSLPARQLWEDWLQGHPKGDRVSERIRAVQALEALGSEVLVVSADVTDREQMKAALEQAHKRFGAIHGVIHAAGIAGGGMIQLKEGQAAEKVLAPKVKGTLVLGELLADVRLDFFVMCSSLASLLGGIGQVDYCAANAFQDAFAEAQNQNGSGSFTITINWDTWQETGMGVTADLPPELMAVQQEALKRGIKNREGMEAFGRILQSALPQVLVSTRDFGFRLEQATAVGRIEESSQTGSAEIQRHSRPNVSSEYVAPRNEIEQRIAEIWGGLLGIDSVGVNDDFFELGGHSLLATQIVSRVRHDLHVALPMQRLFEVPTVAGLSLAVIEERTSLASGESLAEAVAAMEQLSEEEVVALLAAQGPGQDVSDD